MTPRRPGSLRRFLTRGSVGLGVLLAAQVICAAVFILDILSSMFGLRAAPMNWQLREVVELGAALGLIAGIALGAYALRHVLGERNLAEARLRAASGAFMELLDERFCEWNLTPAERDVALFAIKGLSLQEIASLRATSEGTVKAQCNAIYRKAGVTGRPQLLSLFIDDLMAEALPERAEVKPAA